MQQSSKYKILAQDAYTTIMPVKTTKDCLPKEFFVTLNQVVQLLTVNFHMRSYPLAFDSKQTKHPFGRLSLLNQSDQNRYKRLSAKIIVKTVERRSRKNAEWMKDIYFIQEETRKYFNMF